MTNKDSWDDLMGDLFDLDGDGKTSLDEELLVYSLFRINQGTVLRLSNEHRGWRR